MFQGNCRQKTELIFFCKNQNKLNYFKLYDDKSDKPPTSKKKLSKRAEKSPGKEIAKQLKWQRLPKNQQLEDTHILKVTILQMQ